MMEAGQICRKIAGREKGRYCVILKIEGNFAEISGAKKYGMCKRKRCNLKHLIPTKFKIQIKGEKQEDIERSISETGIIKKLSLIKDRKNKKRKPLIKKEIKPKTRKKEGKSEVKEKIKDEKPIKTKKPETKEEGKKTTKSK